MNKSKQVFKNQILLTKAYSLINPKTKTIISLKNSYNKTLPDPSNKWKALVTDYNKIIIK